MPRSVLSVALLLSWGHAQQPVEPRFHPGDPAALTCRIVGEQPAANGVRILRVEVQNPGTVPAEPLRFEVRSGASKGTNAEVEWFDRAQLPRFGRFGRPVAPRGRQTYLVPTVLAGKRAALDVCVTEAAFVEGGQLDRPALAIGEPKQVQRESLGGTFPVTQVTIANPLPNELDVLLLVTLSQPRDATELMGVRLPAGGALDVLIASLPGRKAWIDPLDDHPGSAVKAVRFEVVDWCAVGDAPPDAAIGALRTAYEAWHRWPESEAELGGSFVFHERRRKLESQDEYAEFRVAGRFTVSASGKVDVQIQEGGGANVSMLLRETLSNLRRPSFDELAAGNRLAPVTADRVALVGPGWSLLKAESGHSVAAEQRAEESDDLQVRDGRIVGDGRGESGRMEWEWRRFGVADVVARRFGRNRDVRFTYGWIDERIVPTTASEVVQYGATPEIVRDLGLADLRFQGAAPIVAAPPTGDGVDALRACWEASWRVPNEPIVVEAKFTLQCGHDGVWRGRKSLSGAITMEGLGRGMRRSDVSFDGAMPRVDQVQFAALLRDRLGIWIGRDFNDRPSFEEQFRGAKVLAPDATGTFVVEGGSVTAVTTAAGQVRGMRWRDGGTISYSRSRIGDRHVVTRIEQKLGGANTPAAMRWEAATSIDWSSVGGHLVPTRFVFDRIFGREWGTETLTFRDVRILGPK